MQNKIAKATAFIFARSGSKGLFDKNIKIFNGKPLIAHTIAQAKKSSLFDDVIVSTNSNKIATVAKSYGASVPFIRPEKLATDSSNELLSWKHSIQEYKGKLDCFISLPCTCPLRNYDVIEKMINHYNSNTYDIVVGITKSNISPEFNMVTRNADNSIDILLKDKRNINRRQDAKTCYIISTYAYITSSKYISNIDNLFDGKVGGYEVNKNESIDIDDINDFEYAEYLYLKKKKNV